MMFGKFIYHEREISFKHAAAEFPHICGNANVSGNFHIVTAGRAHVYNTNVKVGPRFFALSLLYRRTKLFDIRPKK